MESKLERYFVAECKKIGAWAVKSVWPGTNGGPDRKVFAPYGLEYMAELKNGKKGVISPQQKKVCRKLKDLGHTVYYIWDKNDVAEFIAIVSKDVYIKECLAKY